MLAVSNWTHSSLGAANLKLGFFLFFFGPNKPRLLLVVDHQNWFIKSVSGRNGGQLKATAWSGERRERRERCLLCSPLVWQSLISSSCAADLWPIVCSNQLLWQQQDFLAAAAAEPNGIKRKFISAFVGLRGSARWLVVWFGYGTLATLLRPLLQEMHLLALSCSLSFLHLI